MGEIEFASVDKYFFLQHQKTIKELVAAIFKQKKTLERVHALKNISFKINSLNTTPIPIAKTASSKIHPLFR